MIVTYILNIVGAIAIPENGNEALWLGSITWTTKTSIDDIRFPNPLMLKLFNKIILQHKEEY